MLDVFEFTIPSPVVKLDDSRSGTAVLDVTSRLDRNAVVRVDVQPSEDAEPTWFGQPDPIEFTLPVGETLRVSVPVQIPPTVPPGDYQFAVRAFTIEIPQVEFASSPSFSVTVANAPRKTPIPNWLIALLAALLLLILALIVYFAFIRDSGQDDGQAGDLTGQQRPDVEDVLVPNVEGDSEPSAMAALRAVGLEVDRVEQEHPTVPAGRVISQDPMQGVQVPSDTLVVLTISTGPPNEPEPQPPVVLSGHTNTVRGLAVLSDGRIASASWDGTVRLWDPTDPSAALLVYDLHTETVRAVTETADGRIASASEDDTVRVWDPSNPFGGSVTYRGHGGSVVAVAPLPDGRIVSGGTDGRVLIWDPDDIFGEQITFVDNAFVETVVPLADGRIASSSSDGTVQVWDPDDVAAGSVAFVQGSRNIEALAQLADGRLASAGSDGSVRVWDPSDLAARPVIYNGHQDWVRAVAQLPDGRIVSGGSDRTVHIWDPDNPTLDPVVFTDHLGTVWAIVVLKDGRIVSGAQDRTIRIWNPDCCPD